MSHFNQDSKLNYLLSPTRSGTFFAPFRSRSANPDGFDRKMELWIAAIEEWTVTNKKLTLALKDIHQTFVADNGIRPDKECLRLVLSEMKRRSKIVPLTTLKASNVWSSNSSFHVPVLDSYIDPKGWLSWSVKKLVYQPASWAISTLANGVGHDQAYSDLTDMSITDTMKFVSEKSLNELSQNLLSELIRISKAEKQSCFEWQHLLELILPIMNTLIDATDGKELSDILDILVEYLSISKHVSTLLDNDTKLIKIANSEDTNENDVLITKKDIAMARLLRAKELLTADADRYYNQAQKAKLDALECYNKKEIAKAKSLLRSHKRLSNCAEQKESQLTNVELMIEQLETTDSNMMILQAYKDGAEALRIANTKLENNTTILDDMYDVTAEARYLNDEMNQLLNNISYVSHKNGLGDTTQELETELEEFMKEDLPSQHIREENGNPIDTSEPVNENPSTDIADLEARLNELIVCQDEPKKDFKNQTKSDITSTPTKSVQATVT